MCYVVGKCCGPKPDSMKNMAKEDAVNYVVDEVPDNILNESSSLLDSQKSVRSIEESVSEAAVIVSPKVFIVSSKVVIVSPYRKFLFHPR